MLNQPNPDIKETFIACLIDMSQHCSPEFLARCGGKVYLSGFYDDSLNTYLCSAQKMLYVHALELVPETYPEDEEAQNALHEELLEEAVENDYFSRSILEQRRKAHPDHFKVLDLTFDKDQTDEERVDAVREYLQGNPEF